MLRPFLALFVVGIILVTSEFFWRSNRGKGEITRKFVHIIVGSFIASWAFFMTTIQIQVLSIVLLLGVLASKKLSLFLSVHSVSRRTWGEVFFAASIGIVATVTKSAWIFAAAMLHLSLADGLAAVIGTKFGDNTGYKVFGQYKTLLGTATFFVVSVIITAWVVLGSSAGIATETWPIIIWLPLVATITENVAVNGFDNVAVPVIVVVMLRLAEFTY